MKDATFRVNEKGRQRVLRDRQKNVHATVRGTLLYCTQDLCRYVFTHHGVQVFYNPYRAGHFVDPTGRPVVGAALVWFSEGKNVFVLHPSYGEER